MTYSGVIFDFNGTLLWDTPLHNLAWDVFLKKHHITLTDTEKREKIHGKGNKDIFRGIYGSELPLIEINNFTQEKEAIYRDMCIQSNIQLADGSTEFFRFLHEKQIPFCIATSSGIENVRFFYDHFNLDRWFSWERMVYDDGSILSKPHPDIFLKAADILKVQIERMVIFEDSIWGIKAAENAGAGKIIVVNSNQEDYSQWNYEIITCFDRQIRKYFG